MSATPTADFVASCTCGWSLLFLHEHTAKDVARAHRQAYPGVHETTVGPLELDSAARATDREMSRSWWREVRRRVWRTVRLGAGLR